MAEFDGRSRLTAHVMIHSEAPPDVSARPDDEAVDAGATRGPTRTAAGRVLSLLGAFARGGGALTLSELSRYADLTLTTTHRLVKELVEWGGVEQDPSGRYRLSNKILELASSSTRALQLRERALPSLIRLHQETGLSVQLAAREDHHVFFLEALRTLPNYSGENRIGGRLPLHAAGTGMVLLAYSSDDFVDEYLSRPLHQYTPHTMVDPVVIREHLADIRRRRYFIAPQTISLETGSVAAPVLGPDLSVIAAVNAIYFVGRHDPAGLVQPILAAANRVSQSMAQTRADVDPRTVDFNRRQAGLL
ncbi:IclR family transcriptional regulator [Microbacterium lushaniae]|uniref:IclR family transcriptional regulator n=1 Tax=Microbacterium lushaniae TaxID=2614639 RepID=A0A5J6L4C1_9MICO|nr:IclR family transcriptional regulator [Microbacterium lushaniae]QEW03216.1 IclR family transcriptional regulator [Microbacterium lushaniae]